MRVEKLLTKSLVIPKNIFINEELTAIEKMLLSAIIMSVKDSEYCEYSNEDIGKIFNLDKRGISRYLSELKKLGFIDMKNIQKEVRNDFMIYHIYCRCIFITDKTKQLVKGGNN